MASRRPAIFSNPCRWGSDVKITLTEGATLVKWLLIIGAGLYVYKRGFGIVGDVANAVGEAAFNAAKPSVESATKDSALNTVGTIQSLQESTGMNQDQATVIDLLALGSMGA